MSDVSIGMWPCAFVTPLVVYDRSFSTTWIVIFFSHCQLFSRYCIFLFLSSLRGTRFHEKRLLISSRAPARVCVWGREGGGNSLFRFLSRCFRARLTIWLALLEIEAPPPRPGAEGWMREKEEVGRGKERYPPTQRGRTRLLAKSWAWWGRSFLYCIRTRLYLTTTAGCSRRWRRRRRDCRDYDAVCQNRTSLCLNLAFMKYFPAILRLLLCKIIF